MDAGPALMPGGTEEAYKHIEDIVRKVAAQVDDGPCVTYVGNGGAGNFVKMVHNGIEYGDMQLISEAYDILKTVGGFSNEELAEAFDDWNKVSGRKLLSVPSGHQSETYIYSLHRPQMGEVRCHSCACVTLLYLTHLGTAPLIRPVAMQTELSSFLVEITALIFKKKDEDGKGYILDSIQDKTGMKGTGMNLPWCSLYTAAACVVSIQLFAGKWQPCC